MSQEIEGNLIVQEPFSLKKKRKGGVVNLILGGLLLEAGRMLKEGHDPEAVEDASKKAFLSEKGIYSLYQEIGHEKVVIFLKSFSEEKGKEFSEVYHNFFTLKKSVFAFPGWPEEDNSKQVKETSVGKKNVKDSFILETLIRRFLGVAFMLASEIVEAGVAGYDEVDLACQKALGWKKGPFSLMNEKGIHTAFQIVVEKMESSHRREINFPIPALLVSQVQKNVPWPLTNKSGFYH